MPLTHDALTDYLSAYTKESVTSGGACYGFAAAYQHAVLSGQTNRFFQLLDILDPDILGVFKTSPETLLADIERIKYRIKRHQQDHYQLPNISPVERLLLDIPALFDSILLNLSPADFPDITNQQWIQDHHQTAALTQPEYMETGYHSLHQAVNAFSLAELAQYLESILPEIQDSPYPVAISLGGPDHQITISLDPQNPGRWLFMDINHLVNNRPVSLPTRELAYACFHALAPEGSQHAVLNFDFLSLEANPEISAELEKLRQPHSNPALNQRQDAEGYTMLFLAIQTGLTAEVEQLVTGGADINHAINDGESPLHCCVTKNNLSAARILLAQPSIDVNAINGDGYTPLVQSIIEDHSGMIKLLVSHPHTNINLIDDEGLTPLMAACEGHTAASVQALLQHPNIDLNQTSPENLGQTALHIAMRHHCIESVRLLCHHRRINLDVLDDNSHSPLYLAAKAGKMQMVLCLLNAGASKTLGPNGPPVAEILRQEALNPEIAELIDTHNPGGIPIRTVNKPTAKHKGKREAAFDEETEPANEEEYDTDDAPTKRGRFST